MSPLSEKFEELNTEDLCDLHSRFDGTVCHDGGVFGVESGAFERSMQRVWQAEHVEVCVDVVVRVQRAAQVVVEFLLIRQ